MNVKTKGRQYLCAAATILCLTEAISSQAQTVAVTAFQPQGQTAPQAQLLQPLSEVQKLLDKAGKEEIAYHWQQALDFYDQALALARSRQDKVGEATTLNNIGAVYEHTGQPVKALDYYRQALPIRRATGDKDGEATTLNNIGLVSFNMGQSPQALDSLQQALPLFRAVDDKKGEATTLTNIGLVYGRAGEPAKALNFFQQAAPIFRAIADKSSEAATLTNIGGVYSDTGEPAKALDFYGQALLLRRAAGDKQGEATTLNNIGLVYSNTGQPPKALEFFQQALPLARAVGDKTGEASTLNNLGLVCYATGQTPKALDYFQQAAQLKHVVGDKAGEATSLNNIGGVYYATGQSVKALDFFQQAVLIRHEIGDKAGEASTLNNIGLIHANTGQPAKALNYFLQAAPLQRAAGDRAGEAATLSNIGLVNANTGQAVKALDYLQQAARLKHVVGDKAGEATALSNIGGVYDGIGQPLKALDYYGQALPMRRAAGDKAGEAVTLNNIGIIYARANQSSKALEYLQLALPMRRAVGDKRGEATTLNNIGYVYDNTGQWAKALEFYEQALLLRRAVGDKNGEASTLNNIGGIYDATNQFAKALEHYQQALPLEREISDKVNEANTLANIGFVYARQNQLQEAEPFFRQAITQMETLRNALGGLTEAKIAISEIYLNAYTGCMDLLRRQNRPADAFALAQQTKARGLLDLLTNGKVDLTTRLNDEERRQFAALRARPTTINRQMIAEGVRNETGSKQRFAELQQQLKQAERDLAVFTDTEYARHPDLAQARTVHTLSAEEAARLLPPDTALLEYATGKDTSRPRGKPNLVLFVITGDGKTTAREISATPGQLKTLSSQFRALCANPHSSYQAQARQLYRLLLAPAEARLAGKKHWLICPDGPLWNVPFAALQDSKGRFVSQRHTLTFAYSATGAATALTKRTRPRPSGSVLALANPDFGDTARFGDDPHLPGQRPFDAPSRSRPFDAPSRDLVAQLRGGTLKALPGTQAEANVLRRLYPDAAIYTGTKAQKATFKAEAGKYKYLHLASHAFFNDAAPMLSSIFLAAPPKTGPGSEEDGYLTARDLFDIKLNAELVTLSACQTGRGETHGGEGVIGLTWALTVAGVPTQVVSQWSVDDAATAQLMTGFYTRLKAGKGKGEALQGAATAVRHKPGYRHPYYWAPFILMGDWR